MRKRAQLGLLINEVGNLYQKQIWRSFVDACAKKGMQPLGIIGKSWKSSIDNEAVSNEIYRLVPFLGLDGHVVAQSVISTHEPFTEVEEVCGLDPTRTVYLGEAPCADRACIAFDTTSAIQDALRHLHQVHHAKKIGCITGVLSNPDTQLRLAVYRETLKTLGLPWELSFEADGGFTNEGGGKAALALTEKHPDLDAIYFMNDTMALGAVQVFEEAGLSLSKIKIIGMDDIDEARWMRRPLSTVRQSTDAMSRRAVERLASNSGLDFGGTETLFGEFVIRSSCGCQSHGSEKGRDDFIEEQLRSFFLSRMVRQAAQVLFSDLDPSTWDDRVARAFSLAQVSWAGILEWDQGNLPSSSLENVEFRRWIEYSNGTVVKNSEQFQAPAEILAEKLSTRTHPCLLVSLVCQSRLLGVCLLEITESMDSFYESLLLQVSAALQGTWLMETQKATQHELIAANQQLLNLANRDELTGALNRRGFMLLAEQSLAEARRGKALSAILFVDMDKLKVINDDFGHAEGDRAIRATAQALKESLRQTDILARIGGDEFVIFARIKEESDVRRLVHRANAVLQTHQEEFPVGLKLGFSAGVALCKLGQKQTLDEYIQAADEDLYRQKELRRAH
jgi:diguanylate cyclase (GGDEF)-like protein